MKIIQRILELIALVLTTTELSTSQWTQTGLTTHHIQAMVVNDSFLFAGTGSGVFRSVDNGMTWTLANSGLTYTNVQAFAVQGETLFAGTYLNGIFLSTNNGAIWDSVNTGLSNRGISSLAIKVDINGTQKSIVFAGTGNGVFLSSNNGTTWDSTRLIGKSIYALAVCPPNSLGAGLLIAGAQDSIYVSSDNGDNWTRGNITPAFFGNVLSLAVHPADSSGSVSLFAGTSMGVLLSVDCGEHWALVDSGLPTPGGFAPQVFGLAVSGNTIFASVWLGGVYKSTNNGTSWTDVNTGLGTFYVTALTVHGGVSGELLVGTSGEPPTPGYGVWKRPLSEMITSVADTSQRLAPETFALRQNYPNPFNPITSIQFEIFRRSTVSLDIFDALGKRVAILFSGELSSGMYSLQWNAANLPSGTYFYRLHTGLFSETKKLLLLR